MRLSHKSESRTYSSCHPAMPCVQPALLSLLSQVETYPVVLPCPRAGYRIPTQKSVPVSTTVGSKRMVHHVHGRATTMLAQKRHFDKPRFVTLLKVQLQVQILELRW